MLNRQQRQQRRVWLFCLFLIWLGCESAIVAINEIEVEYNLRIALMIVGGMVGVGLLVGCSVYYGQRSSRFHVPGDDTQREIKAEQKARALLRRLLTPEQLAQYNGTGHFTVPLPNGSVARLGSYRIEWADNSQCVLPTQANAVLPPTDILIAQLLHLRNDPDKLRAIGQLKPLSAQAPWGIKPEPPHRIIAHG